jgi:riboflavin synthase
VRDFRVFFPSDGTTTFGMGGASAAELQKATLATLGFLFAQVLTIDEIIQKISRSARSTDP